MSPIRVLIVDDHTLFRRGIASVITSETDITLVGEAGDGLEAIKKARALSPNVILMDLNMPRCSGLQAIQTLREEIPQINILVLTISENEADLFTAMKFGARGYALKNLEPDELIHAILHIAQGGVIVSPLMATKLLTELRSPRAETEKENLPENEASLSPREQEVLQLVSQGATNKIIADTLVISENTVKTHLRSIMEKLHLANRSQAAAYAVKKNTAAQANSPHATDT